jgi:hypothetical protein
VLGIRKLLACGKSKNVGNAGSCYTSPEISAKLQVCTARQYKGHESTKVLGTGVQGPREAAGQGRCCNPKPREAEYTAALLSKLAQ